MAAPYHRRERSSRLESTTKASVVEVVLLLRQRRTDCVILGLVEFEVSKDQRLCRCGAGDAGCSKCHICKTCAGELNVARDFGGVRINQAAIYNRGWLRPEDRAKGEDNNLSGDESKEVEKAVSKPPILTPRRSQYTEIKL
ncbi:hypothetical protein BSL78_13433 [Apostichopus japonicus]|uniref:Uncharacterized protein n=1 Tax=Stichopus japonicus TaxID=307972 RepID=A0A2G8KNX1_STIJA|nr:hypothetical protein BSL78_13433 [Apostichopus japonicus]